MEQRLSMITLSVPDVANARHFFEEGLGWTRAKAPEKDIAFYQTGSNVLALYSRTALIKELGQDVAERTTGGVTISWNGRTEAEVDAAFEQALAAGAKQVKTPVKVFWGGYSGYVEIPGGHLLELAFNPFWPIAHDGSITLET
ncbi:VOC family protein [Roseibium algae]|uniref:VOC family protein n=1 Tax=Roseibium algae TaxID=3123038 RepID=A0ABU8TI98_9HYPH